MDIPVIKAQRTQHGFQFRCDWCETIHSHGQGEGHRAAHCEKPGSPYKDTGYVLVAND